MLEPFLRAGVIILVVIIVGRIQGLRSFSKMSIFDFALTIATGSLVATAIIDLDLDLHVAIISIVSIFIFQAVIAWARVRFQPFRMAVDNTPILLMDGPRILTENLKQTRVTEADLYAKLREANVLHTDQVVAVILETTGDVAVLHTNQDLSIADCNVLKGVRDTEGRG